MFLTSEVGDYLIIAIIAVFIITLALVIYLLVTGKKSNNIASEQLEKKQETPKEIVNNSVDLNESKVEEIKTNDSNIVEELYSKLPENVAASSVQNNVVEENVKSSIQNDVVEEHEESNAITNIASVLSEMQKDLDASKKNEEEIARYEDEEEKNAIISYKELMKYKDVQDKDVVLEEKTKDEIKNIIENNQESVKKFKRSEFISPIFGYNDDSNVTYREIKRPPRKERVKNSELEWESDRIFKDLEDSNAEVMEFDNKEDNVSDNTTKFLDELVDFRKKLD